MKAKTPSCPLLRDQKVIYCKNFHLRKTLPIEKIFENENLCLKNTYRNCPLFDENKVRVEQDLNICPFVGFETVSFCMAYPVKKIAANHIMTSPCNTGGYQTCPIYRHVTGKQKEYGMLNYKGFLIDEKKRYFENHMWVQKRDSTFRVGLDDFGQYVLGEVKDVTLRSKGERVESRDWIIKVEVQEGTFELYAPISGRIVSVNEELKKFPLIINMDPYGSGWIADIVTEETISAIGPEKAIGLLENHTLMLRNNLLEGIDNVSMTDGGEFVKDLRKKIADREKIRKMISELLKGKKI